MPVPGCSSGGQASRILAGVEEIPDSPLGEDGSLSLAPAQEAAGVGVPARPEAVGGVAYSPKKKQRQAAPMHVVREELRVPELAQVYSLNKGSMITVEAVIVDVGEPKPIDAKKRVLAFHVASASGLVPVSLWSPLMEKYGHLIQKEFSEASGGFPSIVLEKFEVTVVGNNPENKPVVRLQNSRMSSLRLGTAKSIGISPEPGLVVSCFENLTHADHCAILRGVIMELGPLQHSMAGHGMRRGKIVDGSGNALPLVLHGQVAQDDDIAEHAEVILWHSQSLEGLESSDPAEEPEGRWWCYSECYVMRMGAVPDRRIAKIVHVGRNWTGD